jgi:hypothetical protein
MVSPEELHALAKNPRGASLETWSSLLVPHLEELVLVDRHTATTATNKATYPLESARP